MAISNVNALSGCPVYIYGGHIVVLTVLAHVLAPNGARPSADTVYFLTNFPDRKYKDYVYRKMLIQEYLKK